MRTLNLGILAHVDAGKTSLTERLLFSAGVIAEIGSVDTGSTQTDSLALERQRGITIKSAVVSFPVGGLTVNVIDTPGHPDFIAEVERVLSVLDGAVLAVSAVEGVQPQTRVLMRALQRLRIPTLIFVNKIDRPGARADRVVHSLASKLAPAVIPLGSVRGIGTRHAEYLPYGPADPAFTGRLAEALADHDDAILAAYLGDGAALPHRWLHDALVSQTRRALVHPVFFGSAITGAGVTELASGIVALLPEAGGDPRGPVRGTVFKVERGQAGEKIACVRLFSGTVRARDRLRYGAGGEQKITSAAVFDGGTAARPGPVAAGQIGKLWGLPDIQVGDAIGEGAPGHQQRHFAPPTLETVVAACGPGGKGALRAALAQLAEQDPLINLRQDDVRQELSVSLYGEVQKEVIAETLASEFGIEAGFRQSTTICIERPAGTGTAVEVIDTAPNPFLATVGLRVEPAPAGTGTAFRLAIELGSLPLAFLRAIEDTVHTTLREGLYGWQVTDAVVTVTRSGYWPRQSHAHAAFDKSMSSTAGDFRNLTPLVLMAALARAGTTVHEPVDRFHLEIPDGMLAVVLPALARLGAVAHTPATQGSLSTVTGEIPAARVHTLRQRLPALTRGEGVLECAFSRYQPVRGPVPARPRASYNPLNRKEYLLRVTRRA